MKIGLIGTFDVENFGDCAFPLVHREFFRTRMPDAQFTFYSPTNTSAQILGDIAVHALPGDAHTPLPEDALILAGGETIHYGHSSGTYIFPSRSYSAALRLWLSPLQSARLTGARFAVHCAGVRLDDPAIQTTIGRILRSADFVTLRDKVSQQRLSADDAPFPLAVDPMFALRQVHDDDQWGRLAGKHLPHDFTPGSYIAAQVSPPYVSGEVSQWIETVIDLAIEQGRNVLFVPICHFLDDAHVLARAHEVARRKLAGHGLSSHIVPQRIHVFETAALIGMSAGYVGTSLHGAVTAVSFALPLCVLTHSPQGKHQQVLAAIGIDGATATRIADLPAAFRRTQQLDLTAIRDRVTRQAMTDFDDLVAALQAPRETPPRAIAHEDLQIMRRADLSTIRGPKERLKRRVLLIARRFPSLYSRYRALKNRISG